LLFKKCVYCEKYSYSSSGHGPWVCPYCEKDITWHKAKSPGEEEEKNKGNK